MTDNSNRSVTQNQHLSTSSISYKYHETQRTMSKMKSNLSMKQNGKQS